VEGLAQTFSLRSASQGVTPHPARAGSRKRRPRSTLSPGRGLEFEAQPCVQQKMWWVGVDFFWGLRRKSRKACFFAWVFSVASALKKLKHGGH
jgi:hypothetical protein